MEISSQMDFRASSDWLPPSPFPRFEPLREVNRSRCRARIQEVIASSSKSSAQSPMHITFFPAGQGDHRRNHVGHFQKVNQAIQLPVTPFIGSEQLSLSAR